MKDLSSAKTRIQCSALKTVLFMNSPRLRASDLASDEEVKGFNHGGHRGSQGKPTRCEWSGDWVAPLPWSNEVKDLEGAERQVFEE